MWGDSDAMIPIANASDYLEAIPKVQLQTLPKTGHLPQEEQPEQGLRILQKFLSE
jgi:pimeloyl-ACP methyl ester carboxylesterase